MAKKSYRCDWPGALCQNRVSPPPTRLLSFGWNKAHGGHVHCIRHARRHIWVTNTRCSEHRLTREEATIIHTALSSSDREQADAAWRELDAFYAHCDAWSP